MTAKIEVLPKTMPSPKTGEMLTCGVRPFKVRYKSLVGRLLMMDARSMRFETLRYGRDPANPLNGDAPTIKDLSGRR